jgi:hypothetical protein
MAAQMPTEAKDRPPYKGKPTRPGVYESPPARPDKVRLRNTESGVVGAFYFVDAREILENPNTIYELVEGERWPYGRREESSNAD